MRIAVLLITVLAVLYIGAASRIFSWLSAASFGLRIFVAAVFLAPIGFFMGMPFPQGLFALKDRSESVIPWAWGVNGAASVLSAILATMIAVQFGFNILLFFAVVLYGFALLVFPGQRKPQPPIASS